MPWDKNRPRARQGKHLPPAVRRRVIRKSTRCWFSFQGICTGLTGKVEIHHLHDVADGGDDNERGLVAACAPCHQHYSAQVSQRRAVEAAWSWQRKPERHPGTLD